MTTNKSNALMENDVVVRYSQNSNTVSILAINYQLNELRLRVMHEFAWNPSEGVAAVTDIGAGIGAFLYASFRDSFCSAEQWEKLAEQVRIAAGRDDAIEELESKSTKELEVSFDDARLLIDRLGDHSTVADLDAVTALLEKASSNGDGNSKSYLAERWPNLRAVFERRISRERRLNP